jgi:hypothetical protein
MTATRYATHSTKVLRIFTTGAVVALIAAGGFLIQPAGATTPRTVAPSDTTIAVKSSNPNAHYGDAGNIIAVVKAVTRVAGAPTGSVDFFVDGGLFWTATVDRLAKATLPLAEIYPSFYPGTYAITATYSGDANYNASTTPTALSQTLIGISEAPTATITLNPYGYRSSTRGRSS